jgi:transposase
VDTVNEAKKHTRRRYGAELKQQILAQCTESGASVAGVGQSHGINANVVHKWRRQAGGPLHSLQAPGFVPLPLPPSACAPGPDIRIELRRGATSVSVTWPLAATEQCAVWIRELLK